MSKFKKGFTLVESLVAITILVIGVLGPLTIASRGIADGLYAKNQVTANYLAQEAIELVLNKRQTNVKLFRNWLGLTSSNNIGDCLMANKCLVNAQDQTNPITIASICNLYPIAGDSCGLFYNTSTGFYGGFDIANSSGPQFNRWITITRPFTGEIMVTATVTWYNKTVQKSLVLTERLYRLPS